MKIFNSKDYALFEYEQNPSKYDDFSLGDVVINEENEVGIIIQAHGNNEYRTDMFGNCCSSEIKFATLMDIEQYRPKIFQSRNKF